MKTEDLIDGLVADTSQPSSAAQMSVLALPIGVIAAIALFVVILDMRPDIAEALGTWRYDLKLLTVAVIGACGFVMTLRLARPEQSAAHLVGWVALAAFPVLAGIALEMSLVPSSDWLANAIGFKPLVCLGLVPVISAAPLAAGILILRRGAPQSPTLAGASAGFAAGGIGAVIYALHCNNDSPFYVAIWYLAAIAIVTLLGALAGRRFLRW